MLICCQRCDVSKPSSEVRLRGEWICDDCENFHAAVRKEVLELLDLYIERDNKRVGFPDWPDPMLARIKALLKMLWRNNDSGREN